MNRWKNKLLSFLIYMVIFFMVKAATNTIAAAKNESSLSEDEIFYACKENETESAICKCNPEMTPPTLDCRQHWDSVGKLNHTNIKISGNFSFIQALFYNNSITELKKGKVLPGKEKFVEELNFWHNNISFIENGTFDSFIILKSLGLGSNLLTNISIKILTKQIGTTLEYLGLTENKFAIFDLNVFKNMKKLKDLNLSNNNGTNFFNAFPEELANLEILRMGFCGITKFEDNIFQNLRSLKSLDLEGNPLTSIPKSYGSLTNLESLFISKTNFSTLNFLKEFQILQNLWKIEAEETQLERIENCTFCNLPKIESVTLSNNSKLSFIHENAFGSISSGKSVNLTEFIIYGSNISTLPEGLLDWNKTHFIQIHDNPFTCDCSLAWLINDINNPKYDRKFLTTNWVPLICKNPPKLKGKSFYDISGSLCLESMNKTL